MKSLITTSILIAVFGLSAFSQTQQAPNFFLNQPLTGNKHFRASQFIDMGVKPNNTTGFEYNAVNNNEFIAEIDPFMVFPPEEGEFGGPIGNEIVVGNDGVVGATNGSLSVNDAGAAIYQIPLEFPGGISGMTPELSLVYNSSGPDGILGPGWSLGGLSVITCVPATRYHNGIRQAAFGNDFEDGAYTLDGQRLIPVLYRDNDNFREYRTETNVFSKIMRKAITSDSRDEAGKYFEVVTKTGLTYFYGKEGTSRHNFFHKGTSKEHTISYYVNCISDNLGNKINFEYFNDQGNGEISIKSIKYTLTEGAGGDIAIYSIDFDYKTRPDTLSYYLNYKTSSGDIIVKTSTSKVIEKISCTHIETNTIVKEYLLDYILRGPGNDDSKKILHLNAIQEFGKNRDEKYNKTVFEWEDEMTFSLNESLSTLPATIYLEKESNPVRFIGEPKYYLNDFNNDYKIDILRVYSVSEAGYSGNDPVYYFVFEYLVKENNDWIIANHESTPKSR